MDKTHVICGRAQDCSRMFCELSVDMFRFFLEGSRSFQSLPEWSDLISRVKWPNFQSEVTQDYIIRLSGASVRFIQVGSQSDRSWNVPCDYAGLGRNLLRKVRTRPEGSEGSCSWVRVCTWPLHMAGRYRRGPELIGPFRTRPCIWLKV